MIYEGSLMKRKFLNKLLWSSTVKRGGTLNKSDYQLIIYYTFKIFCFCRYAKNSVPFFVIANLRYFTPVTFSFSTKP